MALTRGYSRVEEDGKIAIPEHIGRWAQLTPGSVVEFRVMRVKDTGCRPHMTFVRPGGVPFISPLEVTMMEGATVVDGEGKLVLDGTIMEEARLEPGNLIELKVAGARNGHWLTAHNRVRYTPTFVPRGKIEVLKGSQEVKGVPKGWRSLELDY
ncbi:MAG: hypothetical protein ACE5IA_02965 [Dehalococcoidia bacterium]